MPDKTSFPDLEVLERTPEAPDSVEESSSQLLELSGLLRDAAESDFPRQVAAAASLIGDMVDRGGKLLDFGNGGSASDAQHLCGELVVRFRKNRRALPAIALNCDAAVMTACGNDFSYEEIFSRQIEALGKSGDAVLGISTSGKSPNVVRALRAARSQQLTTILFTGKTDGPAREFADLIVAAPGFDTASIQLLHLAAYHIMCGFLDRRFS